MLSPIKYTILLSSGLLLGLHLQASPSGGLTADNTAGTHISQNGSVLTITGGTLSETNVLHSFDQFNVETGQTADFQAAADTQNIISRVTGPDDSWIDGTLKSTTSNANLYLINPNGIVMGENAQLDVNGAFRASTADYVTLEGGQRVYADPNQGVILTVAAPEAFGFLDNTIGKIEINGSQLGVGLGQDISLVAGKIDIQANAKLETEDGDINTIAVGSATEVRPNITGIMQTTGSQEDITITNSSLIVNGILNSQQVMGRIMMKGNQITMNNGKLQVGHDSEVVDIGDHVVIQSDIDDMGNHVDIQAKNINFAQDSEIIAIINGDKQGSSVKLTASEQVAINNSKIKVETGSFTAHLSNFESSADQGSDIMIVAENIELANKADIYATTMNIGQASSVNLKASKQVVINNSTITTDTSYSPARVSVTDKGSDLTIEAVDIELTNSRLGTSTVFGYDQGSLIKLKADKQVVVNNSTIMMETLGHVTNAVEGNGVLTIEAADIELINGSDIDTTTVSDNEGGLIKLQAINQIRISGSKTIVSSASHGSGAGGDINIQAANLLLQQGAVIQSTSGLKHPKHDFGLPPTGAAGDIRVNLNDTLQIRDASQINTSTAGTGNAGDIIIGEQLTRNNQSTRPLTLWMSDGSTIQSGSSSTVTGAGHAGNLKIFTGESIDLLGNSAFTTESNNAGGGGILVETRDRLRLQDSKITTSVKGGTGQGGNINIDPIFIILENSQIQANAHGGDGGNITLVADYLFRSGPSIIEASSALSTSGDIDIQAVDVDAGSLQTAAEVDPLDVTQWQELPCYLRSGQVSRLIMTGYDAHPTPVDDLSSSLPLWVQMSLRGTQHPIDTHQTKPQTSLFEQAPQSTKLELTATKGWSDNCRYL